MILGTKLKIAHNDKKIDSFIDKKQLLKKLLLQYLEKIISKRNRCKFVFLMNNQMIISPIINKI